MAKTIVISGGTDGMGKALALARQERGDEVIALGSDVEETRRAIEIIGERAIDALVLFANRQRPRRTETRQGLEYTFALYYLSRYLLGKGLKPDLIVNVAGVGITKGTIAWDDLQLTRGYGMVRAQLQAGRLNDLLGVAETTRYVLYHPGFTRSGDLTPLPAPMRAALRVAQRWARPVQDAISPVHDWIDHPPAERLTAVDRGRKLPLTLKTLDPAYARKLLRVTEEILG
jgi:NAD(P)-dependent dehydrogenase (short-subunit alcohol dehydrogenase family)